MPATVHGTVPGHARQAVGQRTSDDVRFSKKYSGSQGRIGRTAFINTSFPDTQEVGTPIIVLEMHCRVCYRLVDSRIIDSRYIVTALEHDERYPSIELVHH